jgi:malate dehydrogenase (oxaloacetate-decarboxylating)
MSANKQPDRDLNTRSLERHRACGGKIQISAKGRIASHEDLLIWYTPGVAAPSRAIAAEPETVFDYTNKANTVAVVSDGSRVLGLGNIGPEAALPVMEGKVLLFKHFGGVDAVPICLDVHDEDGIVAAVKAIAPSFGGINLEDIATPKCFRILERLRNELSIPVWHDDQQGTATVALAGLLNALEIVGKDIATARIVLVGIGAANMALFRLLKAKGANIAKLIAVDSKGILSRKRRDIEARKEDFQEKWQVCCETNGDGLEGGIEEALRDADVCIAFSAPGPDTIAATAIAGMAPDAIVFACANPVPEIWPDAAKEAGARIVATGRGDFPNQVNNSLVFPGLFRGVLDVRAGTITEEMQIAAAVTLSEVARRKGLSEQAILCSTDDLDAAVEIAAAVGLEAVRAGIARRKGDLQSLKNGAMERIQAARRLNALAAVE